MVVEIGFSVRAGMATNPGSNPACHACVDRAPELYKLVGSCIGKVAFFSCVGWP